MCFVDCLLTRRERGAADCGVETFHSKKGLKNQIKKKSTHTKTNHKNKDELITFSTVI
jgi:hypothetical protein